MVNGAELLTAIQSIAQEKQIPDEIIFEGIREGFQKAYEKFFDPEAIIDVNVDEVTGMISVSKRLTVVQKVEDEWLEISLSQAKEKYSEKVTIGDIVNEQVKFSDDYSRLAIFQVGQIIKQKIREGEKNKVYDFFLPKLHEIQTGRVVDITENSYLIDVEGTVVSLWNRKTINQEKISIGDRVTFYIEDVSKDNKHSQVSTSRVHPDFLTKLMEMEVPEISEGIIEVKSVSREPGKRAKVAVYSNDENVDPIGACVGAGGSRIKAVTKELNGEKIDIVKWDENSDKFIMNALAPVRVVSIMVDEEEFFDEEGNLEDAHRECDVVVPNNQLSLAIGKSGMAARLVANLVKMKINIYSYESALEKGIEILWNGNINEVEMNDPEFINNIFKRKSFAENQGTNKFVETKEYDWEEPEEEIVEEVASLDDIQANLEAFDNLVKEENFGEVLDEELDEELEEYDQYYDQK
ncbi:transcription elongation factor NusA [Spiroplasma sabaudiense Ar-1343]|uniref:Transcription termination/antitermination protein NusA n=1 Tax=Spiroplasma sabaudiense Ar-1343 TaxID=1276257 RepID=W6A9X1_9MOLU|nr:transcription termination factor NusA [Spiroplasma sabaudiense]AHI53978.1 transcription elongation factor NusA [Spiroplasma sabaudiense Ar-1343]